MNTIEYINSLNPNGMPPHKLRLKPGAVVMLLRNLNIKSGLCNRTRLIVETIIQGRLLQCTIASGEHRGRRVLIPKILMNPTDETQDGFAWERLQFPVRLSFAMTINKSQGQTLRKVAVWLNNPCFGHGQLYVASSRVGDPKHIKYFLAQNTEIPQYSTRNVVYEELLN